MTAAVVPLDIQFRSREAPLNEIGPPISIAPDGSFLVYVGADPEVAGATALWRRPLDGLEATVIAGTRGAWWPRVSADGRSVVFVKRLERWKHESTVAGAGGGWVAEPRIDALAAAPR